MSSDLISPDTMGANLFDIIQEEIDSTNRDLREVSLMLDQSQVEVEKLSQRNATITMHLQQVSGQGESVPISELKNAYDAALPSPLCTRAIDNSAPALRRCRLRSRRAMPRRSR